MTFDDYLNQAWKDHADDSTTVATGFSDAVKRVEDEDQLVRFVGLVTHVMGEHLGQWEEGLALLSHLREHPECGPSSEAEKSVLRSMEVMKIGGQMPDSVEGFSQSDRIRIWSVAASALVQRNIGRAKTLLEKSLQLAEHGLAPADPASRALAIAGNNMACTLEEKPHREPAETELMILAAHTARKYWEMAGTWLEVSRAEYRLAMTYLKAQKADAAFLHAGACLKLCEKNHASSLDQFFAYEALARVARAREINIDFHYAVGKAKEHFQMLPPEDQEWCAKSFGALSM